MTGLTNSLGETARPGDDIKGGGAKYDGGKSEVGQGVFEYFPRALLEVANVSGYGAAKYSWGGAAKVQDAYTRYGNSLGRHIMLRNIDGPYDTGPGGSGLLHDAQIAWNALMRLEAGLRDGVYTSTRGYPVKPKPEAVPAETKDFAAFEAGMKARGEAGEPIVSRAYSAAKNADVDTTGLDRELPSEAEVEAAMRGFLQNLLGPNVRLTSDPREFYAVTGQWPEGVEKSEADLEWIEAQDFFGGTQFELTPKAHKALAVNKIKPRVAPKAVRKPASRPRPAAKAARAPARKR